MATSIKDLESTRPLKPMPMKSLERAQFDSSMVMVAYAVSNSTADDAQHFARRLKEELAFLCRKHGIRM